MKLSAVLLAAAGIASSVSAQTSSTSGSTGATVAPSASSAASSTASSAATATTSAGSGSPSATVSGGDVFADLKTTKYPSDAYHMPAVRAIHARVQSDAPILVDGVFVSSFGDGELEAGYLSAMDTVNTASVEGALMYVQAEGIDINVRAEEERCARKNDMANVVFYEVLIVQTNETLAQFQETWGETPEYGPMLPMDSGRCTPLTDGKDDFPAGCLQFNGDDGQPNVGPFVGGGIKDDDVRAPYPNNYWFSFPGTCPLEGWGDDKTEDCRASSRKGLCDYGQGPDGVDCTFAYNILGWVTIDDIVGITALDNAETGSKYANFSEWCMADSNNTEFAADSTGEMTEGLEFWENPLNSTANAARAEAMIAKYEETIASGSSQIDEKVLQAFRALPTPEELAASNPPCYQTVEACGSGNGCKRVGYSQLCTECKADEGCETSGSGFEYPELEKAYTELSKDETTTKVSSDNSTTASGSAASGSTGSSTAAPLTFTVASLAVGLMTAVLAL